MARQALPLPVLPRTLTANLPRTPKQVYAWMKKHDLSLRQLAHAIGRNPGTLSRVLHGEVVSAPVWAAMWAFMKNPNGFRPEQIRSQELARKVADARKVIRNYGRQVK